MVATQTKNELLDAALSYARRGWRVFPVHTLLPSGACSCAKPECAPGGKKEKSIGKHPRTAHGLNDATTDERTIRQWWAQWPDANIGIGTGAESGLIVVDIDGDCELPDCLRDLPRTITAQTARGKHLYLAYPDGAKIGNRTKIAGVPIDLRGQGGYVIGPPSLHASGIRYDWLVEPWDCELAEPSAELIAWLTEPKAHANGKAHVTGKP